MKNIRPTVRCSSVVSGTGFLSAVNGRNHWKADGPL